MKTDTQRADASYLRSFVFGVEDSLVSTVGLLSGIAIADVPSETILLTGIILVVVEAFSMAIGEFLSERTAEDYLARRETSIRTPLITGTVMFLSYFVAGFIPLSPYIFFPVSIAFPWSIALALFALFALGLIGARISGTKIFRNGVRMLLIGGIAIAVGVTAGKLLG